MHFVPPIVPLFVLDEVRSTFQRVFDTTKDGQQRKFEKRLREKQPSATCQRPVIEIIAKVDSAVRLLDAERADTVRRTANTILQQAQPTTPNVTKEQQESLKTPKEDIMVLPADKGRT